MRILLLDNYDSFSYNLADYLYQAGAEVEVFRNDEISVDQILENNYDGWVISPGPDTPDDSGILMELLKARPAKLPVLGICLGFQALGVHFGARLERSPVPVHGKVSIIQVESDDMYASLLNRLEVCRYHSLHLKEIPEELKVNAYADQDIAMSFMHRTLPVWGVQYHPEAILTKGGMVLIRNWINYIASLSVVNKRNRA